MIRQIGNLFVLDTASTTYAFRVLPSGHMEHLYYGKKIRIQAEADAVVLTEKKVCLPGNAVSYSKDYPPWVWRICAWKCPPTARVTFGSPSSK